MRPLIRKILALSLLFSCYIPLISQELSKKDFTKAVQNADISFYYDEDYSAAASQYKTLLGIYPENSNLAAKLGICYLNIDGKTTDAIALLTKASGNVVMSDNDYTEYGDLAPLDTYLYLAMAYHKNDSLQKAISLYKEAKYKLGSVDVFREDFILLQIKNCKYAIEMEKSPVVAKESLFTSWLNEYPGSSNPVISKNDSVFIFTHTENGETQILCSYNSGSWGEPIDITKQLGGYSRLYSNSITADGKLLIIYMDDGGDGNLYYSIRNDTKWSKIKSLGRNINTIYWEAHGFITPDGNRLFLASNRPGGEGELDIWVSDKNNKGVWNRPVNCGKEINSPYNENTPFFEPSSNTIYFSSLGHMSMGDYDVFRSVFREGNWTIPTGLPYTLNNTKENTFFIPSNDQSGFITSLYRENNDSRNIYSIITDKPETEAISANVSISLEDGMAVDPEQTHIKVLDIKTDFLLKSLKLSERAADNMNLRPGNLKVFITPIAKKTDSVNLDVNNYSINRDSLLKDTLYYKFNIKPGEYRLIIDHTGYEPDSIDLSLPDNMSGSYIPINASLTPESVANGDFLSINNILFEFDSYKLDDKAINTLERLKSILLNYPELKIEVAGYTDAIGSKAYNMVLANNRAQAVIKYLSDSGIASSRLVKKAYGESGFVAQNQTSDGSDSPEGRKYNRRVTFGIINPQTGITIQQETYTPKLLRQPYATKYNVVLLESPENISPDYFKKLSSTDLLTIKSLRKDSLSAYYIGLFYNKSDATKYLMYAKEKGFNDAYIVTQNETNGLIKPALNEEDDDNQIIPEKTYTIQLIATRNRVEMSFFKGLTDIRQMLSSEDGLYRYVWGEFKSYADAKAAQKKLNDTMFKDSFIRYLNILIEKESLK